MGTILAAATKSSFIVDTPKSIPPKLSFQPACGSFDAGPDDPRQAPRFALSNFRK
jgi:hypothetical protein